MSQIHPPACEDSTEASVVLQCNRLTKRFPSGDSEITVLREASVTLRAGESCAVVGPSGSGKTTLLTLAAGLDRPSEGEVWIQGQALGTLDEDERALLRGRSIGFVFQNHRLLPSLTALENVLLPIEIRGRFEREEAVSLLTRVGLGSRMHHYPSQLSGGEQQRVALARAFVNRPALLLADEPTGSLDRENARVAVDVMFELNAEYGTSLLLVTHDLELASLLQRQLVLRDGEVIDA